MIDGGEFVHMHNPRPAAGPRRARRPNPRLTCSTTLRVRVRAPVPVGALYLEQIVVADGNESVSLSKATAIG